MLLSSHRRVKLAACAEPRTAARIMASSKLNLARCACARLQHCHARPTIDTCRSRELTFTLIAVTMMSRSLRRHLAVACSIVSSKIVFQAFLRSVSLAARAVCVRRRHADGRFGTETYRTAHRGPRSSAANPSYSHPLQDPFAVCNVNIRRRFRGSGQWADVATTGETE